MEKVRFGLVGYGKVAHLHAQALSAATGCRLVSVCGRNEAKTAAFGSHWKIPARPSIEEMVRLDGVEAVVIVTPHPLHHDQACEAFASGCHVIVEKPMALTVAQCDSMIEASRRADRNLGVISQRRWYPSCMRIHDALESGKMGKAVLGQVTMLGWRDEAYYTSDPWRGRWDTEGGGVLINQAPHQLDLLHWYLGPVTEVCGFWDNFNHPYVEVDDSAVASIRFAGGALGSVLVSNSQKPGIYAKVHVHGEKACSAGVQTDGGAMFIAGRSGILEPPYNDLWTIPGEEKLPERWKKEDESFFSSIDATWYFFKLQHEDFALSLRKEVPPAVTGEDGRETVKIIEGIYTSGREHSVVKYR